MRNRLIPILLFVALIAFIGAIYVGLKRESPIEEVKAQSEQTRSKIISIPKESFIKAKWDNYGPGYDGDAQVFMSKTGKVTYGLPVGETLLVGDVVEISARLSSELKFTTSTDIAFSSDVTLLVNDVEQSTFNVIPDNIIGESYTWKVPRSAFKSNEENEISFVVKKDAFYKNGICFYSPIQLKF